jgi:hypothetical protein
MRLNQTRIAHAEGLDRLAAQTTRDHVRPARVVHHNKSGGQCLSWLLHDRSSTESEVHPRSCYVANVPGRDLRTAANSTFSITLSFRPAEKILLPRTVGRVCLAKRSGKIETPFAWKDAILHLADIARARNRALRACIVLG